MKKSEFLVALVATLILTQSVRADDLCSQSRIKNLRKVYFESLNYENPKIAEAIPSFEGQLLADTNAVRDLWKSHGQELGNDKLCRINTGLILIYAAMYLQNTNAGVLAGEIPLDSIPKDQRFTDKSDKTEILLARQKVAETMLREAQQKYLWQDSLLTAFIDSNGFFSEILKNGQLSEETLVWAFAKASKQFPNFMALMHDTGPQELSQKWADQLAGLTTLYIQPPAMSRESYEFYSPQESFATILPYLFVAARIEFADVFAKQADRLVLSSNKEEHDRGIQTLQQAVGVYQSLFQPPLKDLTESWPKVSVLEERIAKAENFLVKQDPGAAFGTYWKSKNGMIPNRCASCHSSRSSY